MTIYSLHEPPTLCSRSSSYAGGYCRSDTVLLDRDEEDEDLEDVMDLLEGARGDRSGPGREEEKTVGVDKKVHADIQV